MMSWVRTTLTLDSDVAAALKRLAEQTKRPFKQVVNEALRVGLGQRRKPIAQEPFEVTPFACGLQPGVDAERLNQLLDELEVQDFRSRQRGAVTVPDVNLLVYAYNADAPHHAAAKRWFEGLMSEPRPVGFTWVVLLGFVRLMTHRAALQRPITHGTSVSGRAQVACTTSTAQILEPGPPPLRPGAGNADRGSKRRGAHHRRAHRGHRHRTPGRAAFQRPRLRAFRRPPLAKPTRLNFRRSLTWLPPGRESKLPLLPMKRIRVGKALPGSPRGASKRPLPPRDQTGQRPSSGRVPLGGESC